MEAGDARYGGEGSIPSRPPEVTMRWILLIVIITGCGDTFESQLFLEGEIDAGKITTDTGLSFDGGGDGGGSWDSAQFNDTNQPETSVTVDGQAFDAGRESGGQPSDATPDTTQVIPCPSAQCDAYCESLDKVVQCYEGVNVCYCWPL